MNIRVILRITGILLMLFSLVMLTPIGIAYLYEEPTTPTFLAAFGITFVTGAGLMLGARKGELRSRDGFMVTALFYLGLGVFGALPIYLDSEFTGTFTEAAFESFSGLTTTGATVITGLDELPKSVLFYRQLLQWLGGMGIIVLAVAILPMLGVGGMQLYRAESPGPAKDTKLTPRIAETAQALWYIYLGLTIACAFAYWGAGMSIFDAICHSFSTVAIGGFSTHDASLGYFDSPMIEAVAIFFMLLAGINFGLHYAVWHRLSLRPYFADYEVRFYFAMIAIVAVVVCGNLLFLEHDNQAIRHGLFQTVSIATTTGFTTDDFSLWPSLVPLLLLFSAFAGGCAGSTAGGIKMVRVLLIYLQGIREIRRLIHPSGVFQVKLGRQLVPDRVIEAVWGFFSVYVFVFLTLVCVFMLMSGMDFETSFSAVAACLNNLGPGLGEVALNYAGVPTQAQWLLILAMLLGRLEIFTLLVLFTPAFWRR